MTTMSTITDIITDTANTDVYPRAFPDAFPRDAEENAVAPLHLIHSDLLKRTVEVHLVGAGGTGSQVASALGRLNHAMRNLGHPGGLQVTIYDPDIVSPANVSRQLFASADIGRAKADVLAYRMNMFFGTQWEAACARYEVVAGRDRAGTADILITCVDSAQARRAIRDRVLLPGPRPIYHVDCGNAEKTGQVVITEPTCGTVTGGPIGKLYCTCSLCRDRPTQRLPTIEEALPDVFDGSVDADEVNLPSCSLAEALRFQDLFINDWVATGAKELLWRLFRDGGLSQYGFYINMKRGRILPVELATKHEVPREQRVKNG